MDLHVAPVVDFERGPVLPDKTEDLFLIAEHGFEVAPSIDRILSKRSHVPSTPASDGGIDVEVPEASQESVAVPVLGVVGNDLPVDGEQRRQIVREGDVRRRAVIDGADAHRKKVTRHARALLDHQTTVLPAARDVSDLLYPLGPDREEGVHDGGDEQLAAIVLLLVFGHGHVGAARLEPRGPTQGPLPSRGQPGAHFLGEAELGRTS